MRSDGPSSLPAAILAEWRAKPLKFAWDVFRFEPDPWQRDALLALPDPTRQRLSLQACAGPGKSAILAVAGYYFLTVMGSADDHPKGAVVAITRENLDDNLMAEFAKWRLRSPLMQALFEWTSSGIYSRAFPDTWFLSARSWPKRANADEQGRTLSGLHSKYVLSLIDESGDIPVSVLKAGEQALSNCAWGMIVQAGNPTSTEGMLYAASTLLRDEWEVICITGDPDDPKRSPRVDIEWARQQIRRWGRDDPWVQSYILGQFPAAGFNQLIAVEDVERAFERSYTEPTLANHPKIIGVDVGRGGRDPSCLVRRWGPVMFPAETRRGLDGLQGAGWVASVAKDWEADAVFIDDTGGYGASWIDQLRLLGHAPIGVQFAGKATSPRYANKRTEMLAKAAEWAKGHGALPRDRALLREMVAVTVSFKGDALQAEPKELVRAKLGGASTDRFDALGLTFAFPVAPRMPSHQYGSEPVTEYDPFRGM